MLAGRPPERLGLCSRQGRVNFDGWNQSGTLTAPKNPIDYSKLKK
jgi:hypothetical protein